MGLATSRQEAFWEACGFGHIAKAKYLLEAGDIDVNWVSYTNDCCPIHTASQGKKEIVELLIQHNCNVNVRDNRGNLALHHAAMKGHAEIVEMLLNAGSEIDGQEKNGWTALHNAAYWCRPEVVKLLIERGCNVHLQNKDERTALHECARSQQKDDQKLAEIARMLIEAGSDINAKSSDFGEADLTGLMFAAYHDHPEVASVLVEAGCELDAIGTTFWTALHWAADRENEEIVYILLDAGANPTKKCLKGETPYDRARSEAVREILATSMQLHKELHHISVMEKLPVVNRAKPETEYKPMCDANFKSQSFLPGNWKPTSSNVDVKNLINEKKARLAAMTKQQYRNELARRTGSSTVITDADRVSENKQDESNDQNETLTENADVKKENDSVDANEIDNAEMNKSYRTDTEKEDDLTEKYQNMNFEGHDIRDHCNDEECKKEADVIESPVLVKEMESTEETDSVEDKEVTDSVECLSLDCKVSSTKELTDNVESLNLDSETSTDNVERLNLDSKISTDKEINDNVESLELDTETLIQCDTDSIGNTEEQLQKGAIKENSEIPERSDLSTAGDETVDENDTKADSSE